MKSIVAGTAGHIDHGKTALVRALTGVDTDRLSEEKRRGISIDLGFAFMQLNADLRLALIDVPGHERFIKNMLAGAGGIDLVLLVIAADESIRPQTREHFDICRLLGIRKGIVVLTKADLVEDDILHLVRLEVEEFVRGSFLENAPVAAVSSTIGTGLPELQTLLEKIASQIEPRDSSRYSRLPIDRAFSLRGFGTVVTGTLLAGSVAPGAELEVHPLGRRVRVRGIQVHGGAVERAFAGQRTALNLAGIETPELARGMVLAPPGLFRPTHFVDAKFNLSVSAGPLKHRTSIHFHTGSAEQTAEIRLLGGLAPIEPGGSAYVRFLFHEPLLVLPGDRFIVRRSSPAATIGGGVVLDIAPPAKGKRTELAARLPVLESGTLAGRIALLVRESRWGLGLPDLVARPGLPEREIESTVVDASVLLYREPRFWLVNRDWAARTTDRLSALVAAFHREHPLSPGIPKEELRSRALAGAPAFLLDVLLAAASDLVAEGETVRLLSHNSAPSLEEETALRKMEAAFLSAGLAAPAVNDVVAASGVALAHARTLLQLLTRNQTLVRVTDDLLLHCATLADLRERLLCERGRRFSVPEFKEWVGVSRKYAIPLLEYLDRERVTRREGDTRLVL
jgi:selenocysteine-specific elongation factor